jgi:DNA polymerase
MHDLIEKIVEIIPNNSGFKEVFIDFETYSDVDFEGGADVYAAHPSTDIICLSHRYIDDEGHETAYMYRPYEGDDIPNNLFTAIKAGIVIHAQNVWFEKCIWKHVCRRRGWPQPHYSQWRDTMAKSAMHAIPLGLEKAAEALHLDEGKDSGGKALIKRLSMPVKGRRITRNEDPLSYAKMYKYCDQDTVVEKAISDKLLDLKDHEQKYWFINQRINERGIPIDKTACQVIYKNIEKEIEYFQHKATEISGGYFTTLNQGKRITLWLQQFGIHLPNFQAQTIKEALDGKYGALSGPALEILTLRQSAGKSSTKKYASMIACCSEDNRVRGTMLYHGAHTGRDAGRLIQPHNFAKPTFKIKDMDELVQDLILMDRREIEKKYEETFMNIASSALRGMIKAPKGKKFYVADYNAIEVRVLFYLAGCDSGLAAYRNGLDIYVEMAAELYKKAAADITESERWYGKTIILGAGFGLGAGGFVNTCANFGIKVNLDFAQEAISSYRGKYPEVVALWNGVEKAAIGAMKLGRETFYRDIKFKHIGNFLYCKLPQGRLIAYPYPKLEQVRTPWGAVKEQLTYRTMRDNFWTRDSTYGGKLVENIVQATARDFMVHGVINLEANGYPVIAMIHDEIISEVDEDYGSIQEFELAMCVDAPWGPGCPILAKGKQLSRYQKI